MSWPKCWEISNVKWRSSICCGFQEKTSEFNTVQQRILPTLVVTHHGTSKHQFFEIAVINTEVFFLDMDVFDYQGQIYQLKKKQWSANNLKNHQRHRKKINQSWQNVSNICDYLRFSIYDIWTDKNSEKNWKQHQSIAGGLQKEISGFNVCFFDLSSQKHRSFFQDIMHIFDYQAK